MECSLLHRDARRAAGTSPIPRGASPACIGLGAATAIAAVAAIAALIASIAILMLLAVVLSAPPAVAADDEVVVTIDVAFHHLGDNFVPTYQPQNTEGLVYTADFTVTGPVENPAIKLWIRGQVPAWAEAEEDQVKLYLNDVLLGYLNEYAMGNGSIYATDDEVEIEISIEEGVLASGTNHLRLETGWGTKYWDRDDIMFWNIRLIKARPIEVSCDLIAPGPGDDALAGLGLTRFDLLVWNDRHVDAIQYVLVTIDPGGAATSYRWTQRTDTLSLEPGATTHASFPGLWSESSKDILNRTWTLAADMSYKWCFPTEGPIDVRVTVRDDQTRMHTFTFKEVLTVRTRLAFAGPVKVVADGAGPVGEGSWVQGGANLTIEVPPVIYDGTDSVRPPPGTIAVAITWDGLVVVEGEPPSGDSWVVHWTVPRAVRATSVLSVEPVVLAEGARPPSEVDTSLEIDSRGPDFVSIVPKDGAWLTSGVVEARATLRDLDGIGVDPYRVQVQCRLAGAAAWGDWQQTAILTGEGIDQPLVAVSYLQLPEGWGHRVRFRAWDLVGNGPSTSTEVVLGVDLTPIVIDRLGPDGWQRYREVSVGCTVTDPSGAGGKGSGVDVRTVEVSTLAQGARDWSPWMPPSDVTGARAGAGPFPALEARATVVLAEGRENYVRWRATDAAGNPVVVSPQLQVAVDLTPPTLTDHWPRGATFDRPGDVASVATFADAGLSGTDPSRVEWSLSAGSNASFGEWTPASSVEAASGAAMATARPGPLKGHENWVRWRAWDVAGNGPVEAGPFKLPVNIPPTAVIALPVFGASFSSEGPVEMSARGTADPDPADVLTYEWMSDLDGQLGYGPALLRMLSPGWHNITLTVDDGIGGDHVATASIRVRVIEPSHVKEPLPAWLFILVIVLVAAGVAAWQWRRWRQRRLLEGA